MFPPYNSQPYPSSQLHSNGLPGSAPAQVMNNPGMQIPPPMFNQQQGSSTPNAHHSAPRFPFQGLQNPNNQINNVIPQMPGQFFAQNAVNPAQFFNPNVNFGLPNSQCNLPNNNLMQTVNQLLQLQMQMQMQLQIPNFAQAGPSGLPFVGVQNPAFTGNAQFMHANGATQQPMNVNLMKQSQQVNAPPSNAIGMVQPHLNLSSLNHPDAAKSQGDPGHAARVNTNGNWKSSPKNNFKRNQRRDGPHTGFSKGTPPSHQNAKRNFKNHNVSLIKGHDKGGIENSFMKQNQMEKKRPLPLLYTEQEVRQWREDRKKNYPSRANVEKNDANADRLRRQQLKEILAKQAELGCEIAEIPSSYLLDWEQTGHERENRRPLCKKEKFQFKSNKRGRFDKKNHHFSKRQKFENLNSSNTQEQNDVNPKEQKSVNNSSASRIKREPTLLQKLLGADIKRDKRHLLQVFRFMVMNSFFTDCTEKPQKFPSVIVKESGNGNVVIEQESPIEEPYNDEICKQVSGLSNGSTKEEEEHQEEGEIID